MPLKDGTGPQGKGPQTGRGLGRCKKGLGSSDNPQQSRNRGTDSKTGRGQGKGKRLRRGSRE
ncbi:MAG: DUF5320 domain-containing protein [Bacteroidales bacterium]